MKKAKELFKGNFFKVGVVVSVIITSINALGIVDSVALNGTIWPGLVFFGVFDMLECGVILTRTATIDAEIKNRKSTSNNRINGSKIPSHIKVNDREGISLDERKIYLVPYDKMGFENATLSTEEKDISNTVNTEHRTKVKVRKRTRDYSN